MTAYVVKLHLYLTLQRKQRLCMPAHKQAYEKLVL